ncbi:unnamed protein product [Polarella glacialis]|uniref:Fe2OG dioxygenase domain-containing protein n=1 Tax=Polarella glacialis TaxID=89957 RepID=A0A813EG68_POLGL|nr:unnamed protein product [Polarella glacialis]
METFARRASSLLVAGLATLAVGIAVRFAITRISWSSAKALEEPDAYRGARIVKTNAILLVLSKVEGGSLDQLAKDFCGIVITEVSRLPNLSHKTVYLCGDIAKAAGIKLWAAERVYVVRELSYGFGDDVAWPVVDVGRVPILVHGVGVYFRRFFDLNLDCFNWIQSEHIFQNLTESTKPGVAHRTGIYLTPVEKCGEEVHFRLLRCSSNFSGPTVNFGTSDKHIIETLNQEAAGIFQNWAPLNHVLAQIYNNAPAKADQKQTKAKIKGHSDKTKDMPVDGSMAFCTFYDQLERLQPLDSDSFDYGHKGISGLTKLIFRLKSCVANRPGCNLKPKFSVTLYPNSVFFMPLSTNQLYTHEIQPGGLDVHLLPTRMGYVARCSETEAVHKDGQTFLKMFGDRRVQLEPPTREGMNHLRSLYAEENFSDVTIDYSKYGPILFSMNEGDYAKPLLDNRSTNFRLLEVCTDSNLFEELLASVQFENVGKGRQGTVLVKPDGTRGIPIVRTTTKYASTAQCFQSLHVRLAQQIRKLAWLPVDFNNALIESYTNAYTTMAFHSDQALDLEEGSSIALFSCYRHPELASPPRRLVVESKEPGGGRFEIPLTHNSVVVFSLETNRQFKHKIVLDTAGCPPENQWLGVTFRTSKAFVKFPAGRACFEDGTPLTLANDDQRRQFYKLRQLENEQTDFIYPCLTFTISESDMMPLKLVN